ncbi:protein phosphatase 2C domain-containing protein [Patescibacteria group bacterium]|nr:protein phosphatase 2C domain-containing protein [Patescibacteria group bacterium]MBU2265000.1 protein phosphatase 2C domain-containing protein [Patescibacteria group bacterium]
MNGFEIAGGTVMGKDHRVISLGNQDAYWWFVSDKMIVAVVCDGCGSAPHSEVGAKIGARLVVESVRKILDLYDLLDPDAMMERVRRDALAQLRTLALNMGQSLTQTVSDLFLFTVMGFALTNRGVITFSVGDGFHAFNGKVFREGPFPGNAPPYLAYGGLIDSSLDVSESAMFRFKTDFMFPLEMVESVLIASDGLEDLIAAADNNLPGKKEKVGSLKQFWETGLFFENPDSIRRRLFQINREVIRPDWENQCLEKETGWLADDTTLVVARRQTGKEASWKSV